MAQSRHVWHHSEWLKAAHGSWLKVAHGSKPPCMARAHGSKPPCMNHSDWLKAAHGSWLKVVHGSKPPSMARAHGSKQLCRFGIAALPDSSKKHIQATCSCMIATMGNTLKRVCGTLVAARFLIRTCDHHAPAHQEAYQ